MTGFILLILLLGCTPAKPAAVAPIPPAIQVPTSAEPYNPPTYAIPKEGGDYAVRLQHIQEQLDWAEKRLPHAK